MKNNIKSILSIAVSILLLNACGGGDNKSETQTDETVTIDTSNVQTLEEVNTTVINYCKLGEELVQGGKNDLGKLDASRWTMTLDTGVEGDLGIKECLINGKSEARGCLQVDPQKPGTGMYQEIVTEEGKRYRVSAELLGADNYQDPYNYDLGSSYVSVEDHKPVEKSEPIAYSESVKGDAPKVVKFDFDAEKEMNYISLRGDTAFRYPTLFNISVKELIQVKKDSNSTEDTNTTVNEVLCNL